MVSLAHIFRQVARRVFISFFEESSIGGLSLTPYAPVINEDSIDYRVHQLVTQRLKRTTHYQLKSVELFFLYKDRCFPL